MKQKCSKYSGLKILGLASALATVLAAPVIAKERIQEFNIPAQPLAEAIADFSRISNIIVVAPSYLTDGKFSKPVDGPMAANDALDIMLSGVGLKVARTANGDLAIINADDDRSKSGKSKPDLKNDLKLEEVIVTAQKRTESIQDVPISINVVTGQALQDFNLTDFKELQMLVPGIDLKESVQAEGTIDMRGIKNVNSFFGVEPVVETYWNGIPVTSTSAFGSMFDLERVEFLRGPQGSLQGRPAPGGVILLSSRRPDVGQTSTLDGTISSRMSVDGDYQIESGVSLPIIQDQLAVRIAGIIDKDNGPTDFKNIHTGNEQEQKNQAFRLTLAWEPRDDLSITVIGEHNKRVVDEAFTLIGNGVHGEIDGYDRAYNLYDYGEFKRTYNQIATTIEWDILGHRLTSLTGYANNKHHNVNNFDFQDTLVPGIGPGADNHFRSSQKRWVQELRFESRASGFWEYMFGAYYLNSKTGTLQDIDYTAAIPNYIRLAVGANNQEQIGVFTHHRFHFTDRLNLQTGLRWQQYKDFRFSDTLQKPELEVIPGVGIPATKSTDSAPTWSMQLSYDVTDDAMAYISYQRSYRPKGQLASRAPVYDASVFSFAEETSDSVELGIKSTLLDGRLQANINLYRQEFEGLIGYVSGVATDGGVAGTEPNGAWDGDTIDSNYGAYPTSTPSIAQGVEMEFQALPFEALVVSGSLSYNQVERGDGAFLPCSIPDGNGGFVFPGSPAVYSTCDVSGQKADIPEWSYSLTMEYTEADLFSWADFYMRALYSYRDTVPTTLDLLNPDIDSFGLLNLSTGLRSKDSKWDISLWAKNLTDKHGLYDRFSGDPTNYGFVTLIPERSVGLSINYDFSL